MCALVAACVVTLPARAEREHTVRAGQSLRSIARTYRIDVGSLAAANARTAADPLRAGEVLQVPPRGVIVLGSGQTLWSVARAHGCSVAALARANRIDPSTQLRPGRYLVLPGAKPELAAHTAKQAARAAPSKASSPAQPCARGRCTAKLFRVATDEHLTLTLTDERGRVRREATNRLARFLRPRNSTKQKRPDARLVGLLAEIARHYPGRTISVISGYRLAGGYTNKESRHTQGRAIDLRVDGVPVRALRDYLRHFPNAGVGFYPNGDFVHLDVRDKSAYWIDLSGAGDRPRYLDRDQRAYFDGKPRGEGLSALGASIAEAIEQAPHEEPTDGASGE